MDKEPIKYTCPMCDADMTNQVNNQCAIVLDVPLLDVTGKTKAKGEHPESVSLQCPNGHWAEYTCPQQGEVGHE